MPLAYPTAVVAASVIAFLVLLALLVAKRVRRDRAEDAQARRLATLRALVLDATAKGGAVDAVRSIARATPVELLHLDRVLRQLDREQLAAVREIADVYAGGGVRARLAREMRSPRPERRAVAALLTARLGLGGAGRRLAPLVHDRDPDVAQAACRALGILDDPDGARVLVRALSGSRIAPERIVENLLNPGFVAPLVDALGGAPLEVRPHIVRALGLIGDPAAEPALLAAALHADDELQIAICRALGTAGTDRSSGHLLAMLRHDEWPVRAQAATALGSRTPTPEVVTGLEDVLGDPAWWVRANAASSLARLGGTGIAGLIRATRHADRYARARAEEALALIAIRGARAVS